MFGPEAQYEVTGDVSHVVFPTGYTVAEDGDTIHIYYGAADTSICMATGSIRQMLNWLDVNSSDTVFSPEVLPEDAQQRG